MTLHMDNNIKDNMQLFRNSLMIKGKQINQKVR